MQSCGFYSRAAAGIYEYVKHWGVALLTESCKHCFMGIFYGSSPPSSPRTNRKWVAGFNGREKKIKAGLSKRRGSGRTGTMLLLAASGLRTSASVTWQPTCCLDTTRASLFPLDQTGAGMKDSHLWTRGGGGGGWGCQQRYHSREWKREKAAAELLSLGSDWLWQTPHPLTAPPLSDLSTGIDLRPATNRENTQTSPQTFIFLLVPFNDHTNLDLHSSEEAALYIYTHKKKENRIK